MTLISEFGRILRQVVETTPGAQGAVFSDWEGEPVDQFSLGETLDLQISGAQWGIVLSQLGDAMAKISAGAPISLHVLCDRAQIFVRSVANNYYMVLEATPEAHIGKAIANLEEAAEALEKQM